MIIVTSICALRLSHPSRGCILENLDYLPRMHNQSKRTQTYGKNNSCSSKRSHTLFGRPKSFIEIPTAPKQGPSNAIFRVRSFNTALNATDIQCIFFVCCRPLLFAHLRQAGNIFFILLAAPYSCIVAAFQILRPMRHS